MSKRSRQDAEDDRPPKRSKPTQQYQAPVVEDIQFARQLQQLLSFRQDGIQQLRNGIASFKAFLESILYRREPDDRARQLSILREYLDTQKPVGEHDPEKPFLGQLWQAWSFASQNNNDYLASSVSAILAQLLRTLSSLLDFRDYGILLCRTVLQHQHLRLVKRGLGAPNHKDFIISPCLRLLTEVTSFDGGVLARDVYKRREQTFDISNLRRNLGLARSDITNEEARRKPSIRTLTVRYILAHLKYLHEGGKIDVVKNRPLCFALFQQLADDPPEIVTEILNTTEQNVLKDGDIPRSAKATLLIQHNLERVTEVATRSGEDHQAAARAFAWLKAVCTTETYGILRSSGWYPAGTAETDHEHEGNNGTINLGLDSLEFYDRNERPDVRNTTLLGWIQTLRPQSDPKERELVLTCFQSAPELVAAYFAEKNMQLEPKLSNTWIGYASFVFEVIQLPVPDHLGSATNEEYVQLPPQTNIVLENILPRPLTQKVLTRCLNQSSELITFFAVRLLVLSLQKLSSVLSDLRRGASRSAELKALWDEASERLLSRFVERTPSMKDVISTFRKVPDDDEHAVQREAVTRLLQLYYAVTPVQALEEQFDISTALTTALARSDENESQGEVREMRALELQHLLAIARQSPGMRWFSKQGGLQHSPLVSLLKLHMRKLQDRGLRDSVAHVLVGNSVVADRPSLDALLASVLYAQESIDGPGHEESLWTFIDECFARASRAPVKYLDELEAAVPETALDNGFSPDGVAKHLPSLLAAVVNEQSKYMTDNEVVGRWVEAFLLLHMRSAHGVGLSVLKAFHGSATSHSGAEADGRRFDEQFRTVSLPEESKSAVEDGKALTEDPRTQGLPFEEPPVESSDHPELFRWAQKDVGVAIEERDIDGLILCLCSKDSDIRQQALAQLRILTVRLRTSTQDDKDGLSILIGELVETFERQCLPEERPLPYLAGTFTIRALHVLTEPTHYIYPKLNRFLIRSPEWRINRLPAYWLANTVMSQPDEDDAYWKEVRWVLDWLVDGLRSPADLEILRRGNVFEKVMALGCSPAARRLKGVRERIMELVFRATCVEGGSGVVTTRAGMLSWLEMSKDEMAAAMKKRILETCERDKIERWSGVKLEDL